MSYRLSKRVMGVRVDDISLEKAITEVTSWMSGFGKIVVTPGPEFLLTAQKDEEFKKILNTADLSLPDGFGLRLAGIKNRVPGTDFMLALCREAAQRSWSIGLLGGREGVAKIVAKNLRRQFPKVRITFAIDGRAADQILSGSDAINDIKEGIDILFVAFGHPKQEKLLWRLKIAHCPFRVGMGVGGAFDYLSETTPRPPKFLRAIGLEWLWRFFAQPHRFRRIFNATIVFPIVLFWNRGKVCS